MRIGKIRKEKAIDVNCLPGDSLTLLYGGNIVVEDKIGKTATFDKAVIFDVEGEDIEFGIGGAFIESKKEVSK